MERRGYVYIMASGPSGTLYIGVTANPVVRIDQHRRGVGSAFCREHGCTTLVHVEVIDRIDDAIAREKALKRWKRQWKLNLIGRHNPDWRDLWDDIARP
jgi:putative endonuclease